MKSIHILLFTTLFVLNACNGKPQKEPNTPLQEKTSTEKTKELIVEKDFLYNQYSLEDTYPYKDTVRVFQWEKIRNYLVLIDSIQTTNNSWGILQNRNNINGQAPLVETYSKNAYKNIIDTFGVERFQGIPLYLQADTTFPERYGLDGSLVKVIKDTTVTFISTSTIHFEGNWIVPQNYIKFINDSVVFRKVIFVDRTNQNITTLEKVDSKWLVRSMNPATTGLHKPPHMQETPLGIFVIQEKKNKMVYLEDNSTKRGGFAPYANRFCNGGYIHGVPVNVPRKNLIEYSPSLGTTPRSHMCVRNVTSHSKFIFEWAPVDESLVIVFE